MKNCIKDFQHEYSDFFFEQIDDFFSLSLFFPFAAMQAIMLIITMSEEYKKCLTVVADYGVVNIKIKINVKNAGAYFK